MNSKTKNIAAKFGFNKDKEGLITRYLSEKKNWETHIENTKNYILKSAENKKKGTAVILGSGWWIDIPFDELHEMFETIILVDIVHPRQIINKSKKYPKFKLVTSDISGILEHLLKESKKKAENDLLLDVKFAEPKFIRNTAPDFVVSLNILNQLSFFPVMYLRKKYHFSDEDISEFAKLIELEHLKILPENKSCLITDYSQLVYKYNNQLISETERLKIVLPFNNSRKEWLWNFDLSGNFINNSKVIFKVCALQV